MEIVFETVQTPTAFRFHEREKTEKIRYQLNLPLGNAFLDLDLNHDGNECRIKGHAEGKLGFVKLFEFNAQAHWIAGRKHPLSYREDFKSRQRYRQWNLTSDAVHVEVHNPKENPPTDQYNYATPTQGVWDPLALFFVLKQKPFKKIGDSMALSILSKRGPLYAMAIAAEEKKGKFRIKIQALQGPAGENFEVLERSKTEIWYNPEAGEISEVVLEVPVVGRIRVIRA